MPRRNKNATELNNFRWSKRDIHQLYRTLHGKEKAAEMINDEEQAYKQTIEKNPPFRR